MESALRTVLFAGSASSAILDLGFTGGGGLPAGWSFSRAGAGYGLTSAGVLIAFATGVPRITDRGLLVEEARTNRCANVSLNPAATTGMTLVDTGAGASLSVVSDATELARVGLSGNAIRLIAGTSVAFANISGATGNANAHVLSAWVRGGSGDLRYSGGGTLIHTFGSSTTYRRLVTASVAPDSSRTMMVGADAGQTVYFVLNQMEEGPYVTSPIAVAGAAATRGADVAVVAGLTARPAVTLIAEVVLDRATAATSNEALVSLSDASTANRIGLFRASGSATLGSRVKVGNVAANPGDLGGALGAGLHRAGIAVAAGRAITAVDGVLAAAGAPGSVPPFTQLNIGVGDAGTGSALGGYVRRVRVLSYAAGDTQLQGLTA